MWTYTCFEIHLCLKFKNIYIKIDRWSAQLKDMFQEWELCTKFLQCEKKLKNEGNYHDLSSKFRENVAFFP